MRVSKPSNFELCQEIGNVIGVLNRRVEIERVVGVFPEVVRVHDNCFADLLLEAGIELVAIAGPDGWRGSDEAVLLQAARAGRARKNQVLVERRFERARIRDAQNGVGPRQEIRKRQARLNPVAA